MVLCLLDGENDRQVYKLRDLVGAAASSSLHERISLRKEVMLPVRYGMTRDGLMASLWRQLLIALAKGLHAPLCSVGSQDFVGRRPEENMVQKSGCIGLFLKEVQGALPSGCAPRCLKGFHLQLCSAM